MIRHTDDVFMARKITHNEEGPYVINEDELEGQRKTVADCQCGLSTNKPHCDGSHQAAVNEKDDVVYQYEGDDDVSERTVVGDD